MSVNFRVYIILTVFECRSENASVPATSSRSCIALLKSNLEVCSIGSGHDTLVGLLSRQDSNPTQKCLDLWHCLCITISMNAVACSLDLDHFSLSPETCCLLCHLGSDNGTRSWISCNEQNRAGDSWKLFAPGETHLEMFSRGPPVSP